MAETIPFNAEFYRVNTAGGSIYTEIAEVVGITPPNISAGTGNATDLKDTAVQAIKGLADLGEITVTLKYDPNNANITNLESDVTANPGTTARSYVIGYKTITGGGTAQYLTVTGPATGFSINSMEAGSDDPVTCEFTVKVNSKSISSTAPSTA
jgi:hypothetical protein